MYTIGYTDFFVYVFVFGEQLILNVFFIKKKKKTRYFFTLHMSNNIGFDRIGSVFRLTNYFLFLRCKVFKILNVLFEHIVNNESDFF